MRNSQSNRFTRQNQNCLGITLGHQNNNLNPSFNSATNGLSLSGSYTLIQDPLIQAITTDPRLNASFQSFSNPRYVTANAANSTVNNTYAFLPLTSTCNNSGESYYVAASGEAIGTTNSPGPTLQ